MDVVLESFCRSDLNLLAYIDPGTGSLIFQALAATLISAGLFFRGLRERIAWLLAVAFRPKRSVASESEPDAEIAGTIKPVEAQRKAA